MRTMTDREIVVVSSRLLTTRHPKPPPAGTSEDPALTAYVGRDDDRGTHVDVDVPRTSLEPGQVGAAERAAEAGPSDADAPLAAHDLGDRPRAHPAALVRSEIDDEDDVALVHRVEDQGRREPGEDRDDRRIRQDHRTAQRQGGDALPVAHPDGAQRQHARRGSRAARRRRQGKGELHELRSVLARLPAAHHPRRLVLLDQPARLASTRRRNHGHRCIASEGLRRGTPDDALRRCRGLRRRQA